MGSHIHTHEKHWAAITHTHTYTLAFLQGKLVLINLAGRTRHVFPFTSWPVPWVAQWKPSILVCLQFVCLNFLLICIIHWWPVGLVQEVMSEDCRGIYFTQTSYIMFAFFLSFFCKKNCSVGPSSSALSLKESLWRFEVLYVKCFISLQISLVKNLSIGCRRRGLSAWSMKIARRCPKHLWLCDYEGQMFFSHTATFWAAYTTAYHPLDNFFLFLLVSEGLQILSGGKDAMPDYNKRSGLWCWYGEICYMLSQC